MKINQSFLEKTSRRISGLTVVTSFKHIGGRGDGLEENAYHYREAWLLCLSRWKSIKQRKRGNDCAAANCLNFGWWYCLNRR